MSTGVLPENLSLHEHTANRSTQAIYSDCLELMTRKAQVTIVALSTLIIYVSLNSLARTIRPASFIWYAEDREEASWIASSRSWFDRKSCRWLSICGAAHFHSAHVPFGQRESVERSETGDSEPWRSFWLGGADQSEWDAEERAKREIPDYVFDYAPLVHLYSGEQFWPGDIAEHLYHTTPMLNYTPVQARWDHPTLEDLDQLNQWTPRHVYLTSNDNVQTRPAWLEGDKNIPQPAKGGTEQSWADWDGRVDGQIPGDTMEDQAKWFDLGQIDRDDDDTQESMQRESSQAQKYLHHELRKRYGGKIIEEPLPNEVGGRSDAPAILLVMDKGHGVVDAFWFFFYSFNLGNTVVNVRFGNHVGDWEHCLVRFHHGQPKALFFSAHTAGEAYRYEAVEKIGQRVNQPRSSPKTRLILKLHSLSSIPPREAMQCTPHLTCTHTFSHGVYSTTSRTEVHSGTPYSTSMHIHMTMPTTHYVHLPLPPHLLRNGSTSGVIGAINSTRWAILASTDSPDNITM